MADLAVSSIDLRKCFRSGLSLGQIFRGRFFGPTVNALNGIDLNISRGEVVALLGPNGAGKSTFLRLVAGLLLPDHGTLTVLGQDTTRAGAILRRKVCYVICDERSFSWRLSGKQNLEFFAGLYGFKPSQVYKRVERVLSLVNLEEEAIRPVREYSTGMRQRLALARGLLGDPEIFLFDELTRGVDPKNAYKIRHMIQQEIKGSNRTAIIATHDLLDVSQLCHRAVAMEKGKIIADGSPQETTRLMGLEIQSLAGASA